MSSSDKVRKRSKQQVESESDAKPTVQQREKSGWSIVTVATGVSFVALVMIIITLIVANPQKSDTLDLQQSEYNPPDYGPEYISFDFVKGAVPRIKMDPSNTNFAEKIAELEEPVILYNTVVDKWRARSLWNIDYLVNNVKEFNGVQKHVNKTFSYFHENRPMSVLEDISKPYKEATYNKVNMTSQEFFDSIQDCPPYYYYAASADTLGKPYNDLYPIEPLMVKDKNFTYEKSYLYRWTNVWLGPGGATTHTHYDISYNFYAQIYGVKRFVLWPPEEHENLYLYPFLHPGAQQSQVSLPPSEETYKNFPKFRNTKAVEAILFPGDVLYLPPLWFHHVSALSLSMSVSVWTKFPETKMMYETVRSPLPFLRSWDEKKTILAGKVFLDLLLNKVHGKGKSFVKQLVNDRYKNLLENFPHMLKTDKTFCDKDLLPYTREEISLENSKPFAEAVEHQFKLFKQVKDLNR